MKTGSIIIVIFLSLLFVAALSADEKGEEIFKAKGCAACHKKEGSSGSSPSLPEIATAYKGKQNLLLRYFKGEADPIVEPERAGTMKRQLEKTKAMSDSERTALSDFILSH